MPRRPLCQCGHSYSCHRGDTSKHHEKGCCKAVVQETRPDIAGVLSAPCPCREYRPVTMQDSEEGDL